MHRFLIVMKESTSIYERGRKNRDNQRQRSQTDVLGTGHVIFPPVRITADNSLTLLHCLLHPWPTEWLLEMPKQSSHSALFVWFIRGIGICKSMFLDQWVVWTLKNQTELRVFFKLPGKETKFSDWSCICCPTCRGYCHHWVGSQDRNWIWVVSPLPNAVEKLS